MKQTALLIFIALAAPPSLARCITVQDGPVKLCQPAQAGQPAGNKGTSSQTPPNIPCWYKVSCSAGNRPQVQLSAQAQSVAYGGKSVVEWTSQGASSCSLTSFGSVPTSGSRTTPPLSSTKTYTVTCTGAGGSASQSVTVDVQPQPGPAITLTASPSQFNTSRVCRTEPPAGGWGGGSRCGNNWAGGIIQGTLTWSATNATSCTIYKDGSHFSGGTSGSKGYYAPSPNYPSTDPSPANVTTDTYKAVCTGPGGTSSKSVTVKTYARFFLR